MKRRKTNNRIRVLTVDEQPLVRAGLKTILERATATVFAGEASDNQEAISKASRLDPDVILFGLSASEQSEAHTVQSLRNSAPQARILLLEGGEDVGHILTLLRAGAHGCSSKTSSTTELIRAIRAISRGEIYLSPAVSKALLEVEDAAIKPIPGEPLESNLSPRESQVLILIARGLTNREIAVSLGISARTVETHRERVMRKLDIHTIAGLTRYVIESGIN